MILFWLRPFACAQTTTPIESRETQFASVRQRGSFTACLRHGTAVRRNGAPKALPGAMQRATIKKILDPKP
jgi:hypothetical protein